MPKRQAAAADAATELDVESSSGSSPKTQAVKPKPKQLPPHAVILHNDDVNGMDWVVSSLCKVFRYDSMQSLALTMEAHKRGRSIIWTGHQELAELKADQLRSCGPDPAQKRKGALPLRVTVELLPG